MKKLFLSLLLVGIITGITGTSIVYAISEQDITDRLERLRESVERQQEEIRYLKQQLEEQKAAAEEAKEREAVEIKKAVAQEVKEKIKLPGWVKRINISGDVRTRYEAIWNREEKDENLKDRNKGRLRARLFINTKVSDEFTGYLGLGTNWDFAKHYKAKTVNDDMTGYGSTKNFGLIRCYGEYKPKWLSGSKFGAGKYKLNFLYTDILWDPDCNPEGVYGYYMYKRFKMFQPFLYGSWNILDEQKNDSDPRLTTIQPGFDLNFGNVKWTLAGSYHGYANLNKGQVYVCEGKKDQTMADLCTYGNSTYTIGSHKYYLYSFRLLEGITNLNFKFANIPVNIFFDYIENTADDVPGDHDTAISTGFKVGENKKKGDLSLYFKWSKIEPDSTLGIFNDSDFYGSNRKGTKTKISYNAWDWLTLNAAIFFTEEEKDTGNDGDDKETRFMTDFVAKF